MLRPCIVLALGSYPDDGTAMEQTNFAGWRTTETEPIPLYGSSYIPCRRRQRLFQSPSPSTRSSALRNNLFGYL